MVEIADMITIMEAASDLGITRQAVHGAIARGELNCVEMAGRRLLFRKEVAAYQPRAYRDRKSKKEESAHVV